jgi:hypothetical protein
MQFAAFDHLSSLPEQGEVAHSAGEGSVFFVSIRNRYR